MKPTAEDWKVVLNIVYEILHLPPIDEPFIPTEDQIQGFAAIYDWLPDYLRCQANAESRHRIFMARADREHKARMWTMTAFAVALIIVTPMVIWVELAVNYWAGK